MEFYPKLSWSQFNRREKIRALKTGIRWQQSVWKIVRLTQTSSCVHVELDFRSCDEMGAYSK